MIHAYGLIVGLAVVVGWSVAERIEPKVNKVVPYVLFFGLLGARLYHVIDLWAYYSEHLGEVGAVWNGGLGIYGGIMGGIIGLWIYQRVNIPKNQMNKSFWTLMGAMVVGLPLAQSIGRWGNLANNELWGIHHEPLFLYESILDLCLFILLWRVRFIHPKARVGIYLLGYGGMRLLLEPLKSSPWWVGYCISGAFIIIGSLLIYLTRYTPMGYSEKHE